MKFRIFLLMLGFSFASHAQITISQTEPYKDSWSSGIMLFNLQTESNGLVIVRGDYNRLMSFKGFYIQYYDSNLNLLKDLEYIPEEEKGFIKNASVRGDSLFLV